MCGVLSLFIGCCLLFVACCLMFVGWLLAVGCYYYYYFVVYWFVGLLVCWLRCVVLFDVACA